MIFNEMIVKAIVGGVVGLIFGSLVAFLNYRITKHYIEKSKNGREKGEVISVMSVNLVRMIINTAALAVVFFLRNILPWPLASVAIGTALGLSLISTLLILHLSKCSK